MTVDDQLLEFEPLLRSVASEFFAPGWDRDDLLQEARLGAWEAFEAHDGELSSLRNFVVLCARRKVLTAVTHANRQKHRAVNEALTVLDGEEGPEDAVDRLVGSRQFEPEFQAEFKETVAELARVIRERLTERECRVLLAWVNCDNPHRDGSLSSDYAELAARCGLTMKQFDTSLQVVRWKLTGTGPPSLPNIWQRVERGTEAGYTCPSCGGATRKRIGRGRPARCVVCRVRGPA